MRSSLRNQRVLAAVAVAFGAALWSNSAVAAVAEAGRGRPAVCGCCTCVSPCEIVIKRCPRVEYDYQTVTKYKTVYEEVIETKEIDTMDYVEEIEYRCVPVSGCAPPSCGSCCVEAAPCLQRVEVPVVRAVPTTKTIEYTRIVERQVPYEVTYCKPRTVWVEVALRTCCRVDCFGRVSCTTVVVDVPEETPEPAPAPIPAPPLEQPEPPSDPVPAEDVPKREVPLDSAA